MIRAAIFLAIFLLSSSPVLSSEIIVATASNALKVVRELARTYQELEGTEVRIVSGSTGKLYAQIVNGAPYDVFLSADKERPHLLEQKGIGIKGTRFTYARGVLVVWTRDGITLHSIEDLTDPRIRLVAIANPDTAPYGRAAIEVLENRGLLDRLRGKLLYGENVSQALGFALTGNADASIVALSTVHGTTGRIFRIDPSLHSPIEQDAIALRDSPQALKFLKFLRSPRAQSLFEKYGYIVPSSF